MWNILSNAFIIDSPLVQTHAMSWCKRLVGLTQHRIYAPNISKTQKTNTVEHLTSAYQGVRMYILYFDDACIPGGADLYDLFCDCHATLQIFTMTFHALAGVLNSFATLTLKQQDSEEKRDSAWQETSLGFLGYRGSRPWRNRCFWMLLVQLWTTWVKWLQNGCKMAVKRLCTQFVSPGFVDLFDMCHAAQLQGLVWGFGS